MNKLSFAVFGLLVFWGCATGAGGGYKNLTLAVARSFEVGVTKKRDLVEKVGAPGSVHFTAQDEYFLYYVKDDPYRVRPRVSFVFQKDRDVLREVVWSVEKGDPEFELARAKALFSSEVYTEEEAVPAADSHFVAPQRISVSVDGRVRILFYSRSGEVQSVSWGLPEQVRAVATRKE